MWSSTATVAQVPTAHTRAPSAVSSPFDDYGGQSRAPRHPRGPRSGQIRFVFAIFFRSAGSRVRTSPCTATPTATGPHTSEARRDGASRGAMWTTPKKTKVRKCRQALSAPQRWEKGSAQGRGHDPTPAQQTGCVTLSPRRLWPPGEDGMGGTDTPCHPPQRRLRSLTDRHFSPPHRRRGDVAPGRPPVPVSHPPTQQGVSTGARLRARAPRCPPSHGSHQADARPPAAATHPCPAPCQTRRPLPDETRPRDGVSLQ